MIIKVLASISLLLGCYIAALNWYSIYASQRSNRHVSPVPFFGGILLVVGFLGFDLTAPYAWLGVILDYGTVSIFLVLPYLLWESWTTSRFNLLHRFVSVSKRRKDDIRLYKRGKFTIRTEYEPGIPCNDHGALAASIGRVGRWTKESDSYSLEGYGEDRILRILRSDGMFVTEEENYPDSNKYQHDRMDGLELKKEK